MIIKGPHFYKSTVNNISDSRDRDTSLSDIGREYNSSGLLILFLLEYMMLILMWQRWVQHQNLKIVNIKISICFLYSLLQAHDLVLSCEEH